MYEANHLSLAHCDQRDRHAPGLVHHRRAADIILLYYYVGHRGGCDNAISFGLRDTSVLHKTSRNCGRYNYRYANRCRRR